MIQRLSIDEIRMNLFFDMASDSTAINWYVDKDSKKAYICKKNVKLKTGWSMWKRNTKSKTLSD